MKNQSQISMRPHSSLRQRSARTPQLRRRRDLERDSPPRPKRIRRDHTPIEDSQEDECYSNDDEDLYDHEDEYEVIEERRPRYRKIIPLKPVLTSFRMALTSSINLFGIAINGSQESLKRVD